MNLKLYPYQRAGVQFLAEKPHRLLADDMGLGKTAQVIGAMNELNIENGVIICPASVKYHWQREISRWSKRKYRVFVVKDGKSQIPFKADIIIVNYELLLVPAINNQMIARARIMGFGVVVSDEAHYLKSLTAKRTARVLGKEAFTHHAHRKWMLTGTPVLNRPKELYPILSTLAPEVIYPFNTLNAYGKRFCQARQCEEGWYLDGAANLGELSQRIESFMLRRTRDEVLKELPPQVETRVDLEVDVPPTTKVFTEDDGTTYIDDIAIATIRKETGMAKLPKIIEWLKNALLSHHKIVVFCHHREVIHELQKSLVAFKPVLCYGGMTAEIKQASVDSFVLNDDVRVFIAQTLAGGTGIDGLQGVCNVAVFAEPDWSPGIMDQAIGRLRRIGQCNPVFVYYLMVPGSIDDRIEDKLDTKRIIVRKVMEAAETAPRKEIEPDMSVNYVLLAAEILQIATPALTQIAEKLFAHAGSAQAVNPAPAPAKKPTKAAPIQPDPIVAPPAERQASPIPSVVATSGASTDVTIGMLQQAAAQFLAGYSHGEAPANLQAEALRHEEYKNYINTVLWPSLGATKLIDLPVDKYPQAYAVLIGGPAAVVPAGIADPLGI